jgi:hypothetical protein
MPSLSFKFLTNSDAKNSSSSIRKVENTQFLHKLIDQSAHSIKNSIAIAYSLEIVAPTSVKRQNWLLHFFFYSFLPKIDSMVDKGKRQILTSCCHTGTRWARSHFRFLAAKLKRVYEHIIQVIILCR